jgi:hypothetical protein
MLDYAGSPERWILSRTLWVLVAPPLVGLAWHVWAGRRASLVSVRRVGVASIAMATAATAAHVAWLARAHGRIDALAERLTDGVHMGRLEVGFGLWLDWLSAAGCGLACVVTLAAARFVASRPEAERDWRRWAWLELALAGALLSLLADGFVTMALGWTLAGGAGALLSGWVDARAAAVEGVRRIVGVVALLVGATSLFWGVGGGWEGEDYVPDSASDSVLQALQSHAMPGGGGAASVAIALLLVAAAATSASPPPAGCPLALRAVSQGATTAALGPFLLARAAPLVPMASWAAVAFALVGGAILGAAGVRVVVQRDRTQWMGLVGSAPAGLAWIALGFGGARAESGVMAGSGLGAAALLLAAARRGDGAGAAPPIETLSHALLDRVPERAGELLMAFERWVVDAIAETAATFVRAGAWVAARSDVHLIAAPADAVATRAVRIGRRIEPVIGGSLGRIAWTVVALGMATALAHALRSGR